MSSSGIVLQAFWSKSKSSSLDIGCLFCFVFCQDDPTLLMYSWGPGSGEDSSLHKTCCHRLSDHFVCHFPSLRMASWQPPRRPFLMKVWPMDKWTESQDTSLTSCVRTVLDFFLFLQNISFRYCSCAVDGYSGLPRFFFVCLFFRCPLLVQILKIQGHPAHHATFLANNSLGITLFVQKNSSVKRLSLAFSLEPKN